ncbi:MAG: zinc-ribbon domain-containing protein, partial [Alphaproteobacteria bacterium]|nr:zinc-ribbon domain-containing protein [Alphaproteobacteria bacterium]
MIITCPNCGTHYNIKPEAIKATGTMVKCARCGYSWQQSVIHSVEVREQQITMQVPVPAMAAAPAPVAVAPAPPPPP